VSGFVLQVVPKFSVAAAKPEVVLAEWLCVVVDGFSDCYACLSQDILILRISGLAALKHSCQQYYWT